MPTTDIPSEKLDWSDFKTLCYESQFLENKLCFRGQADSRWTLRPTSVRYKSTLNLEEYCSELLPGISAQISGYVDYTFDLKSERDIHLLLGLLQHYGFPTPLLDWTRSPYVAAFFAFWNHVLTEPECETVSIWQLSLDAEEYLKSQQAESPFEFVLPDSRFNPRLASQDGLFTLSKTNDDLDLKLGQAMKELRFPGLLLKYELHVGMCHLVLKELRMMGLHPATLFDGLDGVCKSLLFEHFVDSNYVFSKSANEKLKASVERLNRRSGKSRG